MNDLNLEPLIQARNMAMENNHKMNAATLFSGIGAPEVAMPHWRWPWHAEIEKFPSAVMAARHSNSINLGDVSAHDFTERAAEIARPDIIVFGSPCQSYSVAGKRLGLDDPRGNLALVALGIVDRLKPRWFVFENVPGLLSSSEGRDFGIFLRTVDELGYSGTWGSLDAQWFGVAQRRERLFFVGHSGDWRNPAAVLLEPEGLCEHHPPRRETGKAVAPTIASRPTGGGGLGTDFDRDGGLIARALTAHPSRSDGETENFVVHALRADSFDASEDGTGRGTPLVAAYRTSGNCGAWDTGDKVDALTTGTDPSSHVVAFSSKDYGADLSVEITPTMRAMGHGGSHANAGGRLAVAYGLRSDASRSGEAKTPSADAEGRVRLRDPGFNIYEETAPTLDASGPHSVASFRQNSMSGRGTLGYDAETEVLRPIKPQADHQMLQLGSSVRRLTPREYERLQGFPDDYTLVTYRNKPAADGPRYRALGNSMAVPVLRWILSRIERLSDRDMSGILTDT